MACPLQTTHKAAGKGDGAPNFAGTQYGTPGEAMSAAVDFIVESPDQKAQLIVEARTKRSASRGWAAELRRNLLAHRAVPVAPFFLLALPERFYLWKNAPPNEVVPPDFEADAAEALRPYTTSLHSRLIALTENGFELLVRTWLNDLIHSNYDDTNMEPLSPSVSRFLRQSGLLDSIHRGSVKAEAKG